jgi:hypothetical protein
MSGRQPPISSWLDISSSMSEISLFFGAAPSGVNRADHISGVKDRLPDCYILTPDDHDDARQQFVALHILRLRRYKRRVWIEAVLSRPIRRFKLRP